MIRKSILKTKKNMIRLSFLLTVGCRIRKYKKYGENSEILMEERHPARDDHEYTVILPEEIDADESEEVGPPSCRQWDDECDIDDDVDSITSSTSEVSWESGVSSRRRFR